MKLKTVIFSMVFVILLIGLSIFCRKFFIPNLNRDVNILFNTDKNYAQYTKVAIKSAIMNKSPDSIYHINVLCVDIPQKECEEFKLLADKNVEIKIKIETKSTLKNIGNYEIAHYVTRTDLFKFLFSEIYSEDKMLYIDSDTIIRADLTKLYNTDISDYYLAAVMKMEPDYNEFDEPTYFYNCGVLLLNLKKFRERNISNFLIMAKNEDEQKDYQTQRVFNEVITRDEMKVLSPIYNDIERWNDEYIKNYNYFKTYFPYSLKYPTIKQLDKNAVIVHYAGSNKPWKNDNVKYADEWWKYARLVNPIWQIENKVYEKKMSKELR